MENQANSLLIYNLRKYLPGEPLVLNYKMMMPETKLCNNNAQVSRNSKVHQVCSGMNSTHSGCGL